jgi:hypothetical protein
VHRIQELVRDIGVEPRLRDPDRLEPVEHLVDRAGQLLKLRIRAGLVDPLLEVAATDAAGGGRDARQRHQQPRDQQPSRTEHQRHPHHEAPDLEPGDRAGGCLEGRAIAADQDHAVAAAGGGDQPIPAVGRGPGRVAAFRPGGISDQPGRPRHAVNERAVMAPDTGEPGELPRIDPRPADPGPGGSRIDWLAARGRTLQEPAIGLGIELLRQRLLSLESLQDPHHAEPRPKQFVEVALEGGQRRLVIGEADEHGSQHEQ